MASESQQEKLERLRRELQEAAEAGGATSRRLLLSKDEMQSAGAFRRALYYSGSLMTSGSFTMMASSTVF